MTARLLVDAGNTRLKWAVADAGGWTAQGACDYQDCSRLHEVVADVKACFIACVADTDRLRPFVGRLARAGVAVDWLVAEARFGDLTNGYASPAQLGVDRWMGLIAARARTRDPALVISAGTAVTVDALSAEGVFLGGIIMPGLTLMQQALHLGTAAIAPSAGQVEAFPRTTADAVHSGLLAAVCGGVRRQFDLLAARSAREPRCILSGGDAGALAPHLGLPFEIVPALVLEGIDHVAEERMHG